MLTNDQIAVEVALGAIKAVQELDEQHDISVVLHSVTVKCNGPGQFEVMLDAHDIDALKVEQSIHDALKGPV